MSDAHLPLLPGKKKGSEHATRQPQVVEAVSAGGQDGWRSVGD